MTRLSHRWSFRNRLRPGGWFVSAVVVLMAAAIVLLGSASIGGSTSARAQVEDPSPYLCTFEAELDIFLRQPLFLLFGTRVNSGDFSGGGSARCTRTGTSATSTYNLRFAGSYDSSGCLDSLDVIGTMWGDPVSGSEEWAADITLTSSADATPSPFYVRHGASPSTATLVDVIHPNRCLESFDSIAVTGQFALPADAVDPQEVVETVDCRGVLDYTAYYAGDAFEGLDMTNSEQLCEAPDPVLGRNVYVAYTYGDCQVPSGEEGACFPPLEIQSAPMCERHAGLYTDGSPDGASPYPHEELTVRGVPGASFDGGTVLELYTGTTTVALFGDDPAQVRRLAESVVVAPGTAIPAGGQILTDVPGSSAEPEDLPPPRAAILRASVEC